MVPTEPRITPCNHLFCETCIRQALSDKYLCPIDRQPCSPHQLRSLDGLLSRVWGGIQVKCGYHENGCAWRGSIADYSAHTENCSVSKHPAIKNNSALMEEVQRLRGENDNLRNKLDSSQQMNAINAQRFRTVLASTQRELISARENFEIAKLLVEDLHTMMPRADGGNVSDDINLVMRHTACSSLEAARALMENDNKVVSAIMSRATHIKDIAIVMGQADCSRKDAIEALIENRNDLINAIMSLTT